jgi:SP family sugar:H+ symporter-like MFS transporter
MAIGLMWAMIMVVGTLFLDESPRWNYRHGFTAKAGHTIARTYRVSPDHPIVIGELQEIQEALDIERAAGNIKWHEVFTTPTMLRRIVVGMVLQMLQQLTGANYFFYYGTAIFSTAKVGDSYVTAVILGSVNFVATFVGIWSANRHRHRSALINGAILIGSCLLVSFSVYPG